MQFSSKEDIEAPIEQVFAMLSEFESFERSAIRRGIEVIRTDSFAAPIAGYAWNARFKLRGKMRDMDIRLVNYDQPSAMRFESESKGIEGSMMLDMVALSPRRTRMSVSMELNPKSLSAKLLVQSLKLAKNNLTNRFKLSVADYAQNMEERHSRRV
ncbi:MAG: SRPBCC family protein [Rhodobacteraceae bacterium]|nr:SRPBCC family protein [Paracoccaceae bacterium]